MVTFRFYVVTTVALFLALAIGIVVGSALDERLVSGLESQVARVQSNLDDTIDSIDAKNREIEELEQYAEESAPFAVEDQLPDTTLLVVAEDGVDAGPVEDLVRRARQAGAHADGIVWLDPRWQLAELADRQELATALDLDGGSAVTVRSAAWTALMASMAELTGAPVNGGTGGIETTTSTTSTTTTADPSTTATTLDATTTTLDPIDSFAAPVLATLEDTGFVRLQRVDGEGPNAGTNLVLVLVTGQAADFEPPAGLLTDLSDLAGESGIPTVVAEVHQPPGEDQEGERGSTLAPWRASDATVVSTVDDLDLLAGRVATILALADLREGIGGHYGYGAGADRVLPEWLGP